METATLLRAVQAGYDRYLDDLRALVNVDCGSFTPAGVNRVADACADRLSGLGFSVRRIPHVQAPGQAELGDCLVATLAGSGRARLLLIGHMDTVFAPGTVAARPFRIEGDRAFGPGVCDMKGGLLAGFHAIEVLRESGWDDFAEIAFVCNPDEEIGSVFSGPIIRKVAEGRDVSLVLECARESGAIVSARKGVAGGPIEVVGRSAHAGVEPERGRSAILAAARLVEALHALNGRWPGVTVNVGTIEGGTRPNVVPDRVRMEIDVRGPDAASFDAATAEIDALVGDLTLDCSAAIRWYGEHRPMERTDAAARLVALAQDAAVEVGIGDLPEAATGGASDANTTAGMGIPTLDGLGPVGGQPHSEDEWLDLASVVPRIALLARLIERVAG